MRGRNQRRANAAWAVMALCLGGCVAGCVAGCSATSTTAEQERAEKLRALAAKNDAMLENSAELQINDVCPITGDTVQPQFVAAYKGRKVAFCCEHCLREFRDADGAGKDAIAGKAFAK